MRDINADRILAFLPAYNEKGKIGKAVSSIPRGTVTEILVIDDGSSDGTSKEAEDAGAKVVRNFRSQGVGSVIRQAIEYAKKEGFKVIVILAGNGKDDGAEVLRLIGPIIMKEYDFVQGSRFLRSGSYGRMPLYRIIATKYIHPLIFSFFVGRIVTDSTNGFRAMRVDIFYDKEINLKQNWLKRYELEPYLYYKVIKLGYRVSEVPVSKIYPPKELGYTKMRPFIDWWLILKPIFLLGFRIRK